ETEVDNPSLVPASPKKESMVKRVLKTKVERIKWNKRKEKE
ncbi:20388_t:CDS:2, partial [Gigaspora rosea]